MNVASRSHVKEPYYVEIEEVGLDYIITHMKDGGYHSLKISKNNNWSYHIPRMELVQDCNDYGVRIKISLFQKILNVIRRLLHKLR